MSRRARKWWLWATATVVAMVAAGTIGVWAMSPKAAAADVTVVEPSSDELGDFANTTVLFGHQSVGVNVLDGIEALYGTAGMPSPQAVQLSPGAAAPAHPGIDHAFVGVNGDPSGKLRDFELLVGGAGAGVEIALVKFCYVDITASTDVRALFDEYVATMDALEQRHPDITFLYATAPLTTDRSWRANVKALVGIDDQRGPADNVARQQYNELVRERYEGTGRLFDIAAVQASSDAGPMSRTHDGEEYFVLNAAMSSDAGHFNETGSRAAASELIRVVTALGG